MTGKAKKKVLIVGAASEFSQYLRQSLADQYDFVGVDSRPLDDNDVFQGEFFQIKYTQRKIAEVFRQQDYFALLHFGRIHPTSRSFRSRYKNNVLGTKHLLQLARTHRVKNIIVMSTYLIYGAHASNHFYIKEDAPLRAAETFPELTDAIELDHEALRFLLQYRELRTVILRPCNIVGPHSESVLMDFFRSGICPKLMGFDPLMQFIHESDMAEVIRLVLEGSQSGVYNIAGEGVAPYSAAANLAGARTVPLPLLLSYGLVSLLNLINQKFPPHLLDYLRYPTIISDDKFRKDYDYQPRLDLCQTMGKSHLA